MGRANVHDRPHSHGQTQTVTHNHSFFTYLGNIPQIGHALSGLLVGIHAPVHVLKHGLRRTDNRIDTDNTLAGDEIGRNFEQASNAKRMADTVSSDRLFM